VLPIPTKLITIDTQGFTLSRVNNAASNTGTIEGGNGAAALNTTADITLTNSGIIRAGAGQANALQFGAARTTVLELQAGSVIQGNALAGATGTSDILRLGGTANDVFDISTVGATAQYRNFDIFQKTGTSPGH
jgi:fibronectin-binding autotransporter adhesin